MTSVPGVRGDYLSAAESALQLIGRVPVVQRWAEPSALPQLTVGGLAAHLGAQLVSVHAAVTRGAGATDEAPVPLVEHYERVAWAGADLEDDANVTIRERAEQSASPGHDALLASLEQALPDIRTGFERLTMPPAIRLPWWNWALSFDDFLLTRVLEIVVHSDDLAVSVDIEPPELPEPVLGPVLALLLAMSLSRHGQSAVVRALTRSERAGDITAF